jgi:hypothetical protein
MQASFPMDYVDPSQTQRQPKIWLPPTAQQAPPVQSAPASSAPYPQSSDYPDSSWDSSAYGPRSRPVGSSPGVFNPPIQTNNQNPALPAFPASFPVNDLLSNPMARFAMNAYGTQIQQKFGGLFGLFHLHKFRYYFHVDHSYVAKKIKILMFPMLHKQWRRERLDGENEGLTGASTAELSVYKSPIEDVNAPDLYIPLMGFVTYILMLAYAYAQQSQFHPEILGLFASRTLVFLFLEVMALKAGFWTISAPVQPPITELVAYCSYKYVPLIVMIGIGLLLGSFAFYLAIIGLGLNTGLFMIRTFKSVLSPAIDAHSAQAIGTGRRNYLLVAIGGAQLLLAFALVKGAV